MRAAAVLVAAAAALALTAPGAEARRPGFHLKRIGTFDEPVYVAAPRGDRRRAFVVEKQGRIRVVQDGHTLATPFLDVAADTRSDGEEGLVGLAFAPDYRTSRRFYVFRTRQGGMEQVVEEYRSDSATTADPGSRRVVLVEDDPGFNHNGGQLAFGPDGLLYVGNGDGGGDEDEFDRFGLAQDPNSIFGKILRLDPTAAAPPEIFQSGLRNPYRFSFDRRTGALIVADVGGQQQEELNYFKPGEGRGANLGWPAFEGTARGRGAAPGAVAPVLTYTHADGACAITGGYVSRDPEVPATRGRYLFGDFCRGRILKARLKQPRTTARATRAHVRSLVSFGEDGRGRVYAVSFGGRVLRVVR